MQRQTLTASKRTLLGRKVKQLRAEGILPATIYGKKIDSMSVSLPLKEFVKVFTKAGETGVVDILLDGTAYPVLIQNVQHGAVDGAVLHADLYKVNLKEKVTARVPLKVVGEAIAVKDKVGVLLTLMEEVEVEALPTDLPEYLEVDVSALAEIDAGIRVANLSPSENVKILTPADHDIVKIAPLIVKEVEEAPPAVEAAPGSEGEEGAVAPATAPAPETEEK